MANAAQELAVHEKRELVSKEEKTVPGRYYIPYTDIHETDEALTVVMEMPGVETKDINVSLEKDVLRVDGQIDFAKYEGMEPVYTEYNVGPYTRSFTLSNKIDQRRSVRIETAHLVRYLVCSRLWTRSGRAAGCNQA